MRAPAVVSFDPESVISSREAIDGAEVQLDVKMLGEDVQRLVAGDNFRMPSGHVYRVYELRWRASLVPEPGDYIAHVLGAPVQEP